MTSSVFGQEQWLDDYALFRALKDKYRGAYYLEWPAELVQRSPNALAEARRELAEQIDQVCFAQFLLLRQGGSTQRPCPLQRHRLDWRSPFLRFPGFQRCLGESGVVPARRAAPPALRGRSASRLFQRPGTVVGQSRLQLGCSARDRLSVVYRPSVRVA